MRRKHGRTFYDQPRTEQALQRSLRDMGRLLVPDYYQPFDPVWTDGTTALAPGTGAGLIAARFMSCGYWTYVALKIVIGTGPTLGAGPWQWTLPRPALPDPGGPVHMGVAEAFDSGTPAYHIGDVGVAPGTATLGAAFEGAAATLAFNNPMAWAAGDVFKATIWYPSA